ncbi:MAG: adenylate/guanylate cyclase domain-containing protein [Betaproteobacteria bacterium]
MLGRLRLYSGLILFAYLVSHLANHALGVISLEAMNAGLPFTVAPWRTLPGTVLLGGAALVHVVLVLRSLYLRQTLRMPAWQIAQTSLGLLIPFGLIGHVLASRGLHEAFGVHGSYSTELAALWLLLPAFGVLQAVLLVVAWIHGCVGLHAWLRLKPWYAAHERLAFAAAVLWPALALAGYVSGGMQVVRRAAVEGWLNGVTADAGLTMDMIGWVLYWENIGMAGFALLLATLFAVRALRGRRAASAGTLRMRYQGRTTVAVRPGMTVLEALRAARIAHASVCGGRGRCSTCRIHIDAGAEQLPAPQEDELRVLRRIAAAASVRLACQLRPLADLSVTPLLPASATAADAMERVEYQRSEERTVAVLFADMRGFTRLAESRLPYDVVFVLNRFREEMARAIEGAGGVVNEFVGDGVMALFGLDSNIETGCRQAMAAAHAMLDRLEHLNRTLAAELGEPLRIGIGIHAGPVILGEMGYANLKGITVVGDVVNTASRLEEMTKRFGAKVVMSEDAATHVGDGIAGWQRHEVEVRGRLDTMTVLVSGAASA